MITSAQNPKIQRLRALLGEKKARTEQNAIALEGVRLHEDALAAGWQPELLLFSAELSARGMQLVEQAHGAGVAVEEVEARLLRSAASTQTPQGLAGIFSFSAPVWPPSVDFVAVFDQIRDPGNLGTMLRSAEAAGAQGAILTEGCADSWSPKVLRAGMGAHFRLAQHTLAPDQIRAFLPPALQLLGAESAPEARSLWDADLSAPLALVIGGEAEGISPPIRAQLDGMLRIPMPGRAESLNAAVAAGILFFEVVRQRHARS